ncbi:MAG: redoxin domain-containing protein [Planctomycetota bacterium]
MTGQPGVPLPDVWDDIPGARRCTPQPCTYRDNASRFSALSVSVYGISTQSSQDQREAIHRLKLPYGLHSDSDLHLARALSLPTFSVAARVLLKRAIPICIDAVIEHCIYPVFPSHSDVERTLQLLSPTEG